jgi:hypothetical protein
MAMYYSQFSEIAVPQDITALRMWRGTIQPFIHPEEIQHISQNLSRNEPVMIQSGHLIENETPLVGQIESQPVALVEMLVEFDIVIRENFGSRAPEAYCINPPISRITYPYHPHLRDDRSIIYEGKCIHALCSHYGPDENCSGLIDLLDYTTIFLAKHLMWQASLRMVHLKCGKALRFHSPSDRCLDSTLPSFSYYSAYQYAFQKRQEDLRRREFGWLGNWPGAEAPHDFASNLKLHDRQKCHCLSGRRYADCHKTIDREIVELILNAAKHNMEKSTCAL